MYAFQAPKKMTNNIEARLAVCSWSLQPETPEALIAQLREIGLSRVQLALDPLRDNPDNWDKTPELFAAAGIEIASGMFGTCLLYTSPSPRDRTRSRMPSSA